MISSEKNQEQEMAAWLREVGLVDKLEVDGETSIEDDVIGAIAGVAAKEVDGVSTLGKQSLRRAIAEKVGGAEKRARGVGVEAGRRETILDLEMTVLYGYSIPEMVINVRKVVAQRILELLSLVTKEINISIVGVDFTDSGHGKVERMERTA